MLTVKINKGHIESRTTSTLMEMLEDIRCLDVLRGDLLEEFKTHMKDELKKRYPEKYSNEGELKKYVDKHTNEALEDINIVSFANGGKL